MLGPASYSEDGNLIPDDDTPDEDTVSGGDGFTDKDIVYSKQSDWVRFLRCLSGRLILSPWQRGLTFYVKKYNIS